MAEGSKREPDLADINPVVAKKSLGEAQACSPGPERGTSGGPG